MRSVAGAMSSLVKEHFPDGCTGVEVGVWEGSTSAGLLNRLPQLKLIMVDHWKKHPSIKGQFWSQEKMDNCFEKALNATDFAKDRRKIMRMDSLEAAVKLEGEVFGFVFIDATHTPQALSKDLEAWGSKISVGGLFFCDDIGGSIDRKYGCKMQRLFFAYAKENGFEEPQWLAYNVWWTLRVK